MSVGTIDYIQEVLVPDESVTQWHWTVNMGSMACGAMDAVACPLGGLVLARGTSWRTGDVVQMMGFVGVIPCRW